ncbi:MAG: hypothetical protein D6753_16945 [Planctomycetota bacterium]|nr:MAG: hypothetical protein D6753_16945 [Planctomycetota bacterium]
MWLALLVFRSQWRWLYGLQLLPESIPEVIRHVAGAVALLPAAWLFGVLTTPAPPLVEPPGERLSQSPAEALPQPDRSE